MDYREHQIMTGYEIDPTADLVAGVGWVITNPSAGALELGDRVRVSFGPSAVPVWCTVAAKLDGRSVVTP
jgi:hypothetical protein